MSQACIGNAQGFWGDRPGAARKLVEETPQLDYLTLDYLAEVSLSIMAIQREKNPAHGFARDFIPVIESLIPLWKEGRGFKVVTNAGGLNPQACAQACVQLLSAADLGQMKVAVVGGDDVLHQIREEPNNSLYTNLDTGSSLKNIVDDLVTANAYIGAEPVAEALARGADIVITGRVADPSLTVACCQHYFGWSWDDYHALAGATLAGHLIECGTQATGGIYTDWLELEDPVELGFPLVEVAQDGSCVITKAAGSGGAVNAAIIKEQMLYEIGDPAHYLSPDITLSLMDVTIEDCGPHRVQVKGAAGRPPPPHYKVSATYRAGYRAEGMLTVIGERAVAKARRCGAVILERLSRVAGRAPERSQVECLGAGDSLPGLFSEVQQEALIETVLRIAVADPDKGLVEAFTKEIAPLVTGGAPGVTGYTSGRPKVRPVFGFWPCLAIRTAVTPYVEVFSPCLK